MANDDKPGWYSVSVEYKPIPSELRPGRGEWYLQATLIHEYRDSSGGIQTEKTPLGSIDVDHIDSVELRQAFYVATDDALNALLLPTERASRSLPNLGSWCGRQRKIPRSGRE